MLKFLIKISLIGFFAFFLLLLGGLRYRWAEYQQPPDQPIDFPHTTHAGKLALPCTFCHTQVEDSRQAGVPPLSTCMSCHNNIATDRPEIIKLKGHYDRGEPVAWEKVHNLPDFIYFSHKRHVRAGVDCTSCHGGVKEMKKMKQVRPLNMGWCVTCHRGNEVSTDCATCHK